MGPKEHVITLTHPITPTLFRSVLWQPDYIVCAPYEFVNIGTSHNMVSRLYKHNVYTEPLGRNLMPVRQVHITAPTTPQTCHSILTGPLTCLNYFLYVVEHE